MMDRRRFLKVAGMTMAGTSIAAGRGRNKLSSGTLTGTRPNIIFVLTDDQGYGDLACHGHPFAITPNLDKLYAQSTRLTDYHVSPACAPTRSALMTGRYPFANGVTHTIIERERMTLKATTIAQILKTAGYATGIFGKWHLGDEDPYQPHNRGFDETFIHGGGGIGQKYPGSCADAPDNKYFDPAIKHNNSFVETRGYCTDIFFKQAMGWIKKNKDRPFFAYISTNAPHVPLVCPDEYSDMYKDKAERRLAIFYGMITNIDDNMGMLMKKLDEWDLADNTLLIFMTDNGSAARPMSFNAGMRGTKGSVNEGGARVPAFFRLPGKIKAGIDIDRLTRHVDIFPTLAGIAGAAIPSDIKLDGRSLIPLLENPNVDWKDRYTFFHKGRWSKKIDGKWVTAGVEPDEHKWINFAVRDEKWRLVGKENLYDIEKDPDEMTNVIQENREIAESMLKAYEGWWKEVRPLMVNEGAPLAKEHPFIVQYDKQKQEKGIPNWQEPAL